MKAIKKYLPAILIIMLEIAIGVLMLIDAEKMTVFIFTLFGAALLILAIVMTFRYLKARKDGEESMLTLITAVVAFVIGLVLAAGASLIVDAGTKLFAVFYGAIMIVNGILKISEYISLKKQGVAASGIRIISGLLSVTLGVIAIVFNYLTIEVIGLIIGITLLAEAFLDLTALIIAHRLNNTVSIYDTSGDDRDYDYDDE